ncbi:efflux RND transporter periplasmic adaptor subunit [Sediminibacterium soli]|uniref:efflux RND transporter periplasmic adaptor subunit n=1 Tax=Sediminibacterium soli TaxID=2698829 RepID=UPI00137A875D|nr:efflux RND transporter periplasmic adaptor subunit [Sediminibacterium soli]NCI46421.1 efflux RND transporter periplasmic adaptor subunit [Sediminibacterium soli]
MRYLIAITLSLVLLACKDKKTVAIQPSDVFYTCSMHPQIMQDRPGKCPICGMDLIRVEKRKGTNDDAIMLSDQQMQLGNIQVDTVGRGIIGDETVLTATVNMDETKASTVSARISGRMEKLYFKNTGDYVGKGERLYDLYSEQLNTAKQEYILALEKQETLDNSIIDLTQLVRSAKNKLLLWGMSEWQIGDLAKTRKAAALTPFYSTASGYITTLEIQEGDYVPEGGTIVRLGDLSSLWVEAQVYASRLSEIDRNGAATVRLPQLGKEITGNIQFVNPEINAETRISLVRISVPNFNNQLKPGMQAYVVVKNRVRRSLTLPIDAVIRNGTMNTVWIQIDKNTFKSVMVDIGLESDDRIEIKSGLKEGDAVAISGAYLLNSEYIFKKGANPMAGHDMGNMKM